MAARMISKFGIMDFEQVNVCWALLLTRNVLHLLINVLTVNAGDVCPVILWLINLATVKFSNSSTKHNK